MLPDTLITQFALASAAVFFAVQILKAVLPLVTKPGTSGATESTAASQSVEFWQRTNRDIVRDALAISVVPILAQQTQILQELKGMAQREDEAHVRAQSTIDAIATDQGKARESLHRMNDRLHEISGKMG